MSKEGKTLPSCPPSFSSSSLEEDDDDSVFGSSPSPGIRPMGTWPLGEEGEEEREEKSSERTDKVLRSWGKWKESPEEEEEENGNPAKQTRGRSRSSLKKRSLHHWVIIVWIRRHWKKSRLQVCAVIETFFLTRSHIYRPFIQSSLFSIKSLYIRSTVPEVAVTRLMAFDRKLWK